MSTIIRSDIRILDSLLALNLNISVWSARKKMCLEDFGGAELPPEDLASLGSISPIPTASRYSPR